jgi:hypothetical protein
MSDETGKSGKGLIFKREILIKLGRLLDMDYMPSELAREIGVSPDTVARSYAQAGMPFTPDTKRKGKIWVNGKAFREWVLECHAEKKAKRNPLGPGEAWCMRCNKVALITRPAVKSVNRYLSLVQGKCGFCGGKINRAFAASSFPEWLKNAGVRPPAQRKAGNQAEGLQNDLADDSAS